MIRKLGPTQAVAIELKDVIVKVKPEIAKKINQLERLTSKRLNAMARSVSVKKQ